jgi:hypothetical protein
MQQCSIRVQQALVQPILARKVDEQQMVVRIASERPFIESNPRIAEMLIPSAVVGADFGVGLEWATAP